MALQPLTIAAIPSMGSKYTKKGWAEKRSYGRGVNSLPKLLGIFKGAHLSLPKG